MLLPASTLVCVVDLRISSRGVAALTTSTSTWFDGTGASRAAALTVATFE
jgi:hypothetical protein